MPQMQDKDIFPDRASMAEPGALKYDGSHRLGHNSLSYAKYVENCEDLE